MKPDTAKGVKGRHPTARVVVVGAGVAGVGAAGTLLAGGLKEVIVLEAADRPGGRVQNAVLEDGFVELGAQFLHGQNDVFDIADQGGMLAEEDSDEDELPDTLLQFSDFKFHTSDGTGVERNIVIHNLRVLEVLQSDSVEIPRKENLQDVKMSLGQFYRERQFSCTQAMKGTEALKAAMFRWMERWECQDTGGPVDQLSLSGAGQYIYCPGNGTRETKGGIAQVFDSLLQDSVPPEHLRLKKAVKSIHWSKDATLETEEGRKLFKTPSSYDEPVDDWTLLDKPQFCINNNSLSTPTTPHMLSDPQQTGSKENETGNPTLTDGYTNQTFSNPPPPFVLKEDSSFERTYSVRIECEDGEVFYADHVIVTASMGVLKENQELFLPPLPNEYREAIDSIGFGNVGKAFMFWDGEKGCRLRQYLPCVASASNVWQRSMLGSDVEGVIPLWLNDVQPQFRSANYKKAMSNGRQWYEDVCMFTTVQSHNFCIAAWAGGEAATVMETLPESEVKDVLHELLAFFLDQPELPPPSRLVRTKWYSNPYTRGAYSYLATGMPLERHALLSQPLPSHKNPVLQLAGEACSQHYYSTLHGALESGRQAAQVILRHHNLTLS